MPSAKSASGVDAFGPDQPRGLRLVDLGLDRGERGGGAAAGDLGGVRDRPRQQLVAREHALHQPEPLRFLGQEHPTREQEVERVAATHQTREERRRAELGRETETRERCRELGVGRREAHVTAEREREPEPDTGAVDRGDDRLRIPEHRRQRPVADRRRFFAARATAQRVAVSTGAEPAPGAGDDERAHGVVGREQIEQLVPTRFHRRCPRVERLRDD